MLPRARDTVSTDFLKKIAAPGRTQAHTKLLVTLGMIGCGSLYSVFGGLIYRLSPTWLRKESGMESMVSN